MKNKTKYIALILVVITCMLFFAIESFAGNVESIDSKPIAEPIMDIESLIKEIVTQDRVENYYAGLLVNRPEKYTYDLSKYILQYSVSTEYWHKVTSFDYNGITENINSDYPTIFIPVFGDVADSRGEYSQRVIGYIKLYYDYLKNEYKFNMAIYNTDTESYKNKNGLVFYEEIADYLVENKIDAKQVLMLKHPNSLSEGRETIAVIQTENDTFILDLANSAHVESRKDEYYVPFAYSIEEYRELRMKAEEELYRTVDSWEEVQFGGNGIIEQNAKKYLGNNLVYIIPAAIIVLAIVALVFVKSRKKIPVAKEE